MRTLYISHMDLLKGYERLLEIFFIDKDKMTNLKGGYERKKVVLGMTGL